MTKAKASDLHAWLGKHGYATSGQAAADAIRWVAAGASNEDKKSPIELNVEKLPAECCRTNQGRLLSKKVGHFCSILVFALVLTISR